MAASKKPAASALSLQYAVFKTRATAGHCGRPSSTGMPSDGRRTRVAEAPTHPLREREGGVSGAASVPSSSSSSHSSVPEMLLRDDTLDSSEQQRRLIALQVVLGKTDALKLQSAAQCVVSYAGDYLVEIMSLHEMRELQRMASLQPLDDDLCIRGPRPVEKLEGQPADAAPLLDAPLHTVKIKHESNRFVCALPVHVAPRPRLPSHPPPGPPPPAQPRGGGGGVKRQRPQL